MVLKTQTLPKAETPRRGLRRFLNDRTGVAAVEFAFIGVMQVVLGAFRGAGNTKTAMALSWLNLWGVRVPAVYLLAFTAGWGPTGIWVGMTLGHIVGAVLAVRLGFSVVPALLVLASLPVLARYRLDPVPDRPQEVPA